MYDQWSGADSVQWKRVALIAQEYKKAPDSNCCRNRNYLFEFNAVRNCKPMEDVELEV